ncbi:MAG: hypothetical protein QM758_26760 [Armatimonas sp.]
MESHAEFLRLESLDDSISEPIRQGNWRVAPGLSERDIAMLEYTEKLTRTPAKITRSDIDHLREVGFDDTGILQINLIASWFNYINRVADGLGVGREDE